MAYFIKFLEKVAFVVFSAFLQWCKISFGVRFLKEANALLECTLFVYISIELTLLQMFNKLLYGVFSPKM